ncbi:MAG: hypothetical protein JXN62_00735, partial [Bacteroidales bacterium]|nr:hypothetical protein [Bacteroidales bacterium]
ISVTTNLEDSISKQTDVIYTDSWPCDQEIEVIEKLFLPYQIKKAHLERMNQKGFFLPCPPVTRDKEVSAETLKMNLCKDYEAKEFLLHSQNAILEHLVNENCM